MTALRRWLLFNLVGALGMLIQLFLIRLLHRFDGGHYLWAVAVATELTLLHNFLWHLRYTWREVRGQTLVRLLRFQISNGGISLVGNLLLTRLLVQKMHAPLLVANLTAIVACSLGNFLASHIWTFASAGEPRNAV